MAPLRVLHVTPYSADAWAYGGIPRVAATLARGLARRGHQVTICTTDACDGTTRLSIGRSSATTSDSASALATRDGVAVRVFPNLSNHLAYRYQAFLPRGLDAFMSDHAVQFDVAH